MKIKCTHCEAVLKGKVVFLELDQRTGTYTNRNIPDEFSQGGFPFGVQCSKIMLVEDILTVTKPTDQWPRSRTRKASELEETTE